MTIPEGARFLREHLRPQRALAGRYTLLVERAGIVQRAALLGEHDVGVGAIGGQLERPAGELHPAAAARLERPVDQVLRFLQRRGGRGGDVVDRPREPLPEGRVDLVQGLEHRGLDEALGLERQALHGTAVRQTRLPRGRRVERREQLGDRERDRARAVRRFHPCRHADQAALPGFVRAAREPLEAVDDVTGLVASMPF